MPAPRGVQHRRKTQPAYGPFPARIIPRPRGRRDCNQSSRAACRSIRAPWASGWRAGDAALSAQRRVPDGVRPRVTRGVCSGCVAATLAECLVLWFCVSLLCDRHRPSCVHPYRVGVPVVGRSAFHLPINHQSKHGSSFLPAQFSVQRRGRVSRAAVHGSLLGTFLRRRRAERRGGPPAAAFPASPVPVWIYATSLASLVAWPWGVDTGPILEGRRGLPGVLPLGGRRARVVD